MAIYVQRTLSFSNEADRHITDEAIPGLELPVVILGEPGIGKTDLMTRLGAQPGFRFIRARDLVRSGVPMEMGNGALVIDGLDEVSVSGDADAIERVLKVLCDNGRPPFILACRAADWRGAVARGDIAHDYGRTPTQLQLEPFTRAMAAPFLADRLGAERAEVVLAHLEARGLGELYGNPLTLHLVSQVAAKAGRLPGSRADLLAAACEIMRSENNRDDTPLARLDAQSALDAAGAACASLLFSNSDAISLLAAGRVADGDVHEGEIAALPGGGAIRTVVGSTLFKAAGGDRRFIPIHRTVAEWLAARWIGRHLPANNDGRLHGTLGAAGGVPASLRGVHAWLPHFRPSLAERVIRRDPYGVIRYGAVDGLSTAQAKQLLDALVDLARRDPLFRSGDWNRHAVGRLGRLELAETFETILNAKDLGFHLRSLMLEALDDPAVIERLSTTLISILRDASGERVLRERDEAAQALLKGASSRVDWPELVGYLSTSDDDDSRRLAVELLSDVGPSAFTVSLIVTSALAYLRLGPGDHNQEVNLTLGPMAMLALNLEDDQVVHVLDALSKVVPNPRQLSWETRYELRHFVHALTVRALKLSLGEPAAVLRWLRAVGRDEDHNDQSSQELSAAFVERPDLRRGIQARVLIEESDQGTIWGRYGQMIRMCPALAPDTEDMLALLDQLANLDPGDARIPALWSHFLGLSRGRDVIPPEIVRVAERFTAGRPALAAELERHLAPPVRAEWELESEARRIADIEARDQRWAAQRTELSAHRQELRAGSPGRINGMARLYLRKFPDHAAETGEERLAVWLGPELAQDALAGFEAILNRRDLRSGLQISKVHADGSVPYEIHPLLAGLVRRLDIGQALEGLADEVILTARIGSYYIGSFDHSDRLRPVLDERLFATPALAERFWRTLIEPALAAHRTTVNGLYELRNKPEASLACALFEEWLERFDKLSDENLSVMVDRLVASSRFTALNARAATRLAPGGAQGPERDLWRSVLFIADFDGFAPRPDLAAPDEGLFWAIRARLNLRRWRDRPAIRLSPDQLSWLIEAYRGQYPDVERPKDGWVGDSNPWDASQQIFGFIDLLSADAGDRASSLMEKLASAPRDDYTDYILTAAATQRRTSVETRFQPVQIEALRALLTDEPPRSTAELREVVLETLSKVQARILGSDTDDASTFYDGGSPLAENACRNSLLRLMTGLLPYGITKIPERLMPSEKRADAAFALRDLQMPMEIKGQWHRSLWEAVETQLGPRYTIDWAAQGCGVYVVFWFGPDVSQARRLKASPDGERPATAADLQAALQKRLPARYAGVVSVFVLDVSRPCASTK